MNTRTFNCGILLLIALVGLVAPGCSQEAKLARHLANANEYYASGSYDKAELEYKNVLQLSAQNSEAEASRLHLRGPRPPGARRLLPLASPPAQHQRPGGADAAGECLPGHGRNKEAREEALYVLEICRVSGSQPGARPERQHDQPAAGNAAAPATNPAARRRQRASAGGSGDSGGCGRKISKRRKRPFRKRWPWNRSWWRRWQACPRFAGASTIWPRRSDTSSRRPACRRCAPAKH